MKQEDIERRMAEISRSFDPEEDVHSKADDLLMLVLKDCGYYDLVEWFEDLPKHSDTSPLYSSVECPCGSASLSYWDTTVDEREKIVVLFQCDDCNHILDVEYGVVSISVNKENDDEAGLRPAESEIQNESLDDGIEEELIENDNDGVEEEIV